MTNLSLYTSKAFKILFTYHIIHNTLYLNFPKVNIDIDNFNCQYCCKILLSNILTCIPVQRSSKGIRIVMISKCFNKRWFLNAFKKIRAYQPEIIFSWTWRFTASSRVFGFSSVSIGPSSADSFVVSTRDPRIDRYGNRPVQIGPRFSIF